MRKALMWIGGILVVLVVGVIGVIAMQPSHTHIERSKVIAATPADIWPYVGDLRGFTAWSPWQNLDPTQVTEFSDPSSGVGAWYSWKGNNQVGSGKMTFTVWEENVKIEEDLEFFEPFAAQADVTMVLTPESGGTKVTWTYDTDENFMGKAMGLVMDMDSMLGGDFEKGLDSLAVLAAADATTRIARETAEAEAAAAAATATAEPAVEGAPANP